MDVMAVTYWSIGHGSRLKDEPTITSHRAVASRLLSVKASTLRSLMWLAVLQTNCRPICGNPRRAPPAPRCAGLFILGVDGFLLWLKSICDLTPLFRNFSHLLRGQPGLGDRSANLTLGDCCFDGVVGIGALEKGTEALPAVPHRDPGDFYCCGA